jgi:ABC-2 type transport system permease protein
VRRYLSLLKVQARMALVLSLQYRFDFFTNGLMAGFWTLSALVPLMVLYSQRTTVAGWSWEEALLVVGFFTILKGVLNGAIQPTLQNVVEHVRKGTLDFLLLKPADAQFIISTSRLELWRGADVVAGFAIVGYALSQRHVVPDLFAVIAALLLLMISIVLLYSIWTIVVSLAFHFVKVDNLSYLFLSLFDIARWPSAVFRGVFAWVFTFVLPLSVMTTFPALALLGRLQWSEVIWAAVAAVLFFSMSRMVWLRSISKYTSAGG